MRFHTLADWLRWQETLHPSRIDLRLERVRSALSAMDDVMPRCPVITVGGTNGKGSCVAMLAAFYEAAGYRTGVYTSPHLLRYNERIRIGAQEVEDDALCEAFERVDGARGETPLTYFEFGTLAALDLFSRASLDVVLLEVGLGGRLDAVNAVDADVAVVTSIGHDHMAWLGNDLDMIAAEKAGIFRPGRPAVIGQRDAPRRLRGCAAEIGALPLQLGREFDWRADAAQWEWRAGEPLVDTADGVAFRRGALPTPALRGRVQYDNASAAICAVDCLHDRLPVPIAALRQGLHRVRVAGRFSVFPGEPTWILDVAHNPEAAAALAENLKAYPCSGRRHLVLAMLADKDAAEVARALAPPIDHWHLAPAPDPRAMTVDALRRGVESGASADSIAVYSDIDRALSGAAAAAGAGDCIVVCGSFTSVEAALRNPLVAPV
ncbi:MAG: bifunctional tetrahydrofolate synthase/dihydrofolate synthase [Thiohalocapsa sp.]|nr:bifunctional tetrahydrofolate synthase/dihydrofolate synthase [Thiohalocapsa sp.]MCF7992037.1 bifunctional tetrahydrofolate synthase/dihydrofolate synthase [Thiohalocapsa sp.]